MPYNAIKAETLRILLSQTENVSEKYMMGGISFMVNDKMCVGVIDEKIICRIDPSIYEESISQNHISPMDFTGRPMKGWIYLEEAITSDPENILPWLNKALEFNKIAKKSAKKLKANITR